MVRPERPRPAGPSPRAAVRREILRAVGGLILLPFRFADFLVRRDALHREFADDLALDAEPEDAPEVDVPRHRPLRIFVSCAEASGELHATNLVRALRERLERMAAPAPETVGMGGERLAGLGVRLVANPVERAAMGFDGVFAAIPYYVGILRACAELFRGERPDVCVLVDSPALHVPLARIARRYGLPVVHFVTPQFWAWAPWRTPAYGRVIDLALTILPFEPDWFRRRGVRVAHVGHPLLDALDGVPSTEPREGGRVMAILPGSREAVIERNLPWMLGIAASMRREVPGLEVVVVQQEHRFEDRFRQHVDAAGAGEWARVEVGDLHGSLARAACAFTVSGTVLLDLLHHRLPTVVVYRVGRRRDAGLYRYVLSTPWFASLNLIARREVVPEFSFTGDGPTGEVRRTLLRCFNDPDWIQSTRDGLELAARRLGPAGACARAAGHVVAVASREGQRP